MPVLNKIRTPKNILISDGVRFSEFGLWVPTVFEIFNLVSQLPCSKQLLALLGGRWGVLHLFRVSVLATAGTCCHRPWPRPPSWRRRASCGSRRKLRSSGCGPWLGHVPTNRILEKKKFRINLQKQVTVFKMCCQICNHLGYFLNHLATNILFWRLFEVVKNPCFNQFFASLSFAVDIFDFWEALDLGLLIS